jgi:hypothetical protein
MQITDFFSLHALLAVIGWTMATGIAIRHLHHIECNRVLFILLVGVCFIGVVGTWIEGAHEHADTRVVQRGILEIEAALNTKNENSEQILSQAATKITTLEQQLHDITYERHLNNDEKTRLTTAFSGFYDKSVPDIIVVAMKGDVESIQYAREFLEFFNSISINSSGSSGAGIEVPDGDRHRPLEIEAKNTAAAGLRLAVNDPNFILPLRLRQGGL